MDHAGDEVAIPMDIRVLLASFSRGYTQNERESEKEIRMVLVFLTRVHLRVSAANILS